MLLRRTQASEHQKETLYGRDGVSLACHLRALSWLARVAYRSKRIVLLQTEREKKLHYPLEQDCGLKKIGVARFRK